MAFKRKPTRSDNTPRVLMLVLPLSMLLIYVCCPAPLLQKFQHAYYEAHETLLASKGKDRHVPANAVWSSSLPSILPAPRLFDCFIFNTELDMLEFRLKTLDAVVDVFVLAEATSTFSGKAKPLVFKDNMPRFEPYLPKIRHIIIEDTPSDGSSWDKEIFQRNALMRAFKDMDPILQPHDMIIGSDVDEVPDPRTLLTLKQHGSLHGMYSFRMDFYYYSFRFRKPVIWNSNAKVIDGKTFQKDPSMTFNKLRSDSAPELPLRGGWHMSYFGGLDFVQNKLQSFSHQEYNNDHYNNPDNILNAIENGKDLFGRAGEELQTVELKDNDYLPVYYEMLMPK